MGWAVPWFSSESTDFNRDFGVTTPEGETFGLSSFLRVGDNVFHTYFTTDRALEAIDSNFTLLDWTPLDDGKIGRLTRDGRSRHSSMVAPPRTSTRSAAENLNECPIVSGSFIELPKPRRNVIMAKC
jgi:hypothetical protein